MTHRKTWVQPPASDQRSILEVEGVDVLPKLMFPITPPGYVLPAEIHRGSSASECEAIVEQAPSNQAARNDWKPIADLLRLAGTGVLLLQPFPELWVASTLHIPGKSKGF